MQTVIKPQFFVYIIETPSDTDLYINRSEGGLLKQMLELSGTPCATRTAISLSTFRAALSDGLLEEMKKHPGRIPIIHISAHGTMMGIGLSCREKLEWNELRELLLPINKMMNGALVVSMSCCMGMLGSTMAMTGQELPYYALVGSFESPTWAETAIAFATFYHLFSKGDMTNILEAMRASSGHRGFTIELATASREKFNHFIETTDWSSIIDKLQAMLDEKVRVLQQQSDSS